MDSDFLVVANSYYTTKVVLVNSLIKMSSNTKDPLEKQDTPTESDESHSDRELEKAEGNLEHLKIETAKNDSESNESKAVDSPSQEVTSSSSGDLFNKILAEQKGLQKPHLEIPEGSSDPECKAACSTGPSKKKELEVEGIGTKMVEGESHKANKKDVEPTIHEDYPSRMEEGESHLSKKEAEPTENCPPRMEEDYDTTSTTSLFIQSSKAVTPTSMLQEISPVAEPSRLGDLVDLPKRPATALGVCLEYNDLHEDCNSKGFDSDTDRENTSADVSEIHSEIAELPTQGSVPHDASEIIEKKESSRYASSAERSSPDDSDTDISELQDYFAPVPPPANSSVSTSNTPESMEVEPISVDQRMQVCDEQFEQGQNVENKEEVNVPEDARKRTAASRLLVQKSVKVCDVQEGSPFKRRKSSKRVSDSSTEEKGIASRLRSRVKQDADKKSKMVTSKPSTFQSTSEYPARARKSSSSGSLHRKEFSENISLGGARDASNTDKDKKSGLLPSMQYSTVSSKDSVITKEKEDHLRSMETKVVTSAKMKTTTIKGGKGTDELSAAKPSSDQAYGSEVEGTLMEQEHSIEDLEHEESIGKSTGEPKLKRRSDQMPTRGTRHDSGDPVTPRVSHGSPQQSESASPTDISVSTISPSQEETKF